MDEELFIIYSHQDNKFKQNLCKQLDVLKINKGISYFSDYSIEVSDQWNQVIQKKLSNAYGAKSGQTDHPKPE